MERIAFGALKLLPEQFYDLTPREFANMLEGHNEVEKRDFQDTWERARWLAFRIAAPPIKGTKKKPTIRLSDFIRFPWEVKEAEPMKKEDFEKAKKAWGIK